MTAIASKPKQGFDVEDDPLGQELAAFSRRARTPRLRRMRRFAEEEIVIPDGPYEGRRYRISRQPKSGLWFDAVDGGQWNRFAYTGPTQSGKTLDAVIIPTMYHLFEIGETVVFGLPDMKMADDKWREDLLPAIARSRFNALRPSRGPGSRGGKVVEAIRFGNGVTLRFMSGGGTDKVRAGFTARVLVVTEVDGLDERGRTSRESTKIKQLIGRTRAFTERTGRPARIYAECTVSTEEGYIWHTYQSGTASRIALRCPECGGWVTPEREHLVGWQAAGSKLEARAAGAFACPACGETWTEEQREAANLDGVLVHKGQEISAAGEISGEPVETDTLGFRYSAVNNLFVSAADVAGDEWSAGRQPDEEQANREMCQFVFAVPPPVVELDLTRLDGETLRRRVSRLPKGLLPEDTAYLTVGVDLGKWLGHYLAIAWRVDGNGEIRGHVPDYGVFEIDTDRLGVGQATLIGLRELGDLCQAGWARSRAEPRVPDQVWIDSGWSESREAVYTFCRDRGERYRPTKGYGAGQDRSKFYRRPKTTGNLVRLVGEEYHLVRLRKDKVFLAEINADYWKSWVQARLATPLDSPGAITFFHALPTEHTKLSKHLTAERQVEEFVPGKGTVTVWKRLRAANHWLDAFCLACAAGHFCGVRLITQEADGVEAQRGKRPAGRRPGRLRMPDGRPYLVTERE